MIDTLSACITAVQQLSREPEIAIDIEGVNLSRTGKISLVQIADNKCNVYLFDITQLGEKAFHAGGLARLLEDRAVLKVIFDGRTGIRLCVCVDVCEICNKHTRNVKCIHPCTILLVICIHLIYF